MFLFVVLFNAFKVFLSIPFFPLFNCSTSTIKSKFLTAFKSPASRVTEAFPLIAFASIVQSCKFEVPSTTNLLSAKTTLDSCATKVLKLHNTNKSVRKVPNCVFKLLIILNFICLLFVLIL